MKLPQQSPVLTEESQEKIISGAADIADNSQTGCPRNTNTVPKLLCAWINSKSDDLTGNCGADLKTVILVFRFRVMLDDPPRRNQTLFPCPKLRLFQKCCWKTDEMPISDKQNQVSKNFQCNKNWIHWLTQSWWSRTVVIRVLLNNDLSLT
jgi:hypothetical protein